MFIPDLSDLLNPAVERRVVRVRRHWVALTKVLLQTVWIVLGYCILSQLISVLGEVDNLSVLGEVDNRRLLQSSLWYVSVLAVSRFAWHVFKWWNEIIIFTDKRIMITGIPVKTSSIPLTKETTVHSTFPLVGQLCGYGTLLVESAGQKQEFKYVPEHKVVAKAISDLIYGDKKQPRSHMLEPPRRTRRRRFYGARWPK